MSDSSSTTVPNLDQVCQLISERASGRASNEQVERAVSELLKYSIRQQQQPADTQQSPPTEQATGKCSNNRKNKIQVQQDMEDYDDVEEDAVFETKKTSAKRSHDEMADGKVKGSLMTAAANASPKNDRPPDDTPIKFNGSLYQDIPLGAQGAKMMIAFGDARCPNPKAVEATLHGARKMLLIAIQDARHLRHQVKAEYLAAKQAAFQKGPKPPPLSQFPAELLYRIQDSSNNNKHDPLARNHPCGFNVHDLIQLFPEEMNAFMRWNQMKEQADEEKVEDESGSNSGSRQDDSKSASLSQHQQTPLDKTNDNDNNEYGTGLVPTEEDGGHLRLRAQKFDARTAQMKRNLYLSFASVRHQGSFLSRCAAASASATLPPDANGCRAGVWAHMSDAEVRFLHWVGFSPDSSSGLLPPNAETTEALAFLASDFVGRIVERSLELRHDNDVDDSYTNSHNGSNSIKMINALHPLTEDDIAKAMHDLQPRPLYNRHATISAAATENGEGSSSSVANIIVGTQLYFGPGFENRVELELQEMTNEKGVAIETDEWLIKEDLLFEQLRDNPPSVVSLKHEPVQQQPPT